jgi:hypothetical protein
VLSSWGILHDLPMLCEANSQMLERKRSVTYRIELSMLSLRCQRVARAAAAGRLAVIGRLRHTGLCASVAAWLDRTIYPSQLGMRR